ncbi:hypothetical protein SAMN05444280_11038 [Tangfeifania diversioriginum]|uniref:Uncharacterized protein n=1 Tax=Tangfeifania diversioriginum TaxID=1168035 RepID=A0A1M6G5G5_9BACT|nr:hypothetical protein [Tangfeifania diversioriginum]SHJ05163.1 hypothetical protein SAMN05444280_11038 [Tangfeifania diversioriginum]
MQTTFKKFLEGNADFGDFEKTRFEDEENNEFIHSYKKLITESNAEVPDFNPFEKVNDLKQKRIINSRRILLYAASVLIIVSLFFFNKTYQQKSSEVVLNQQKLNEIKNNTQMALFHFSKELNACMANFEDAKKMHQPISEMQSLKNYKINSNNPVKNQKLMNHEN